MHEAKRLLATNAQNRLGGRPPHQQMDAARPLHPMWSAPLTLSSLEVRNWPGPPGLQRMKAISEYRFHSIEFERQCAQAFIAGSPADTTFPQPDPNLGAEV